MIAILDVFSGRPNPRWELSAAEAEALRRLLANTPPATDVPAGLGYRGVLVEDSGVTRRVWGGPAEALLLRSARCHLDPSFAAMLDSISTH